jgi:signal transduction histidine kinase
LEEFCEEFAQAHQINLIFDGPSGGDAGLSADGASCLFRVAQECLRNVAKHAHATEVRVSLTMDCENMRLVVTDNGVGFSPEMDRANTGLGLVSMKERIRMANGAISIGSQPMRGTEVVASIPLSGGGQ